jgi:hypothetical protein
MMQSFSDTRHFGAVCTGLATLATSYVADVKGWHLIIPPLLVISAYYWIFREEDVERSLWSARLPRRIEIK